MNELQHANQTLKTLCRNAYNCIIQCQEARSFGLLCIHSANHQSSDWFWHNLLLLFTHMHFRTAPCFACRNSWMPFYSSLQSHDSRFLQMRARKKPSFMHLALAKTTKSEKK